MAYFVFIELENHSVPHMEFLDAATPASARVKARSMLEAHQSGKAARVFDGDVKIATVTRPRKPSGLGRLAR
jgi:hypothetical protein